MLKAYALAFGVCHAVLMDAENKLAQADPAEDVPQNDQIAIRWELNTIRPHCETLSLGSTVPRIDRLLFSLYPSYESLGLAAPTSGYLRSEVYQLRVTMDDELSHSMFLFLPQQDATLFQAPLSEWIAAVAKFTTIQYDVEEAGKSFALGRYTAAVFHLLRVAEVGLDALAVKLNVPTHLPPWDAKLKKIEIELDARIANRTLPRAERVFYDQARVNYRSVQTAWRNPTMHVEKRYPQEIARDIMTALRIFMAHLVSGL